MKFPVLHGLLVCVINWGAGLQKGPMKQVYGLVCSIALTGKAEFAQLLFVSGYLLCMAAMVAALLSPTFGHPQVPREQHLFPDPSVETSQGALCPSVLDSHCMWLACQPPLQPERVQMDFQTLQALFGWSK